MDWGPFTDLSKTQRRALFCPKLHKRLGQCLARYRRDFPNDPVNDKAATILLDLAFPFFTTRGIGDENKPSQVALWCRRPADYLFPTGEDRPQTIGELFLFTLGYLGPLCWGWRASKENTSCAPGFMQIITEHFQGLNPAMKYFCTYDLHGMSVDQVVAHMEQLDYWTNAEALRQMVHEL